EHVEALGVVGGGVAAPVLLEAVHPLPDGRVVEHGAEGNGVVGGVGHSFVFHPRGTGLKTCPYGLRGTAAGLKGPRYFRNRARDRSKDLSVRVLVCVRERYELRTLCTVNSEW